MSFPFYLWLGPVPLHPHWLFETLAYVVGARVYARLKADHGDVIGPSDRWSVVAAAAIGAAVGGKLAYWIAEPDVAAGRWDDPFFLLGGKSVIGALVGALFAVEWVKRWIGVTTATGDLFAVPLAVGIAVGRIGCFLTGLDDHTHGLPTALPWGVDFGDGIPRHPTQLYELAFLLVFAAVLLRLSGRLPSAGDLFKAFMVVYFAFRLALESIKPGQAVVGLTPLQWICLGMLAYYGPWLATRVRQSFRRAEFDAPTVRREVEPHG